MPATRCGKRRRRLPEHELGTCFRQHHERELIGHTLLWIADFLEVDIELTNGSGRITTRQQPLGPNESRVTHGHQILSGIVPRQLLRCIYISWHAIQTTEQYICTSSVEQRRDMSAVILEPCGRRHGTIEPLETRIGFLDPHLQEPEPSGERGPHTIGALLIRDELHRPSLDLQCRATLTGIVQMTRLMMSRIDDRKS